MEDFFEKQSEFVKWLNWRRNIIGGRRQQDLADLIGVAQSTISALLHDKKRPTPSEVIAFAYAFDDVEHVPDLLEMTGYGDILENVNERRKLLGIVARNPGFFYDPWSNDDYNWWEYYYRGKERM